MFPDFTVSEFLGLNTSVKDIKALKPGVSPDSLNWVTSKERDSIALRRGYARLGTSDANDNSSFGPELVANGGFDSDLSSWVPINGASWNAGRVYLSFPSESYLLQNPLGLVLGQTYRIEFDYQVDGVADGSSIGYTHGAAGSTPIVPTSSDLTHFSVDFVASADDVAGDTAAFYALGGLSWFLDNVSIRELTPNTATPSKVTGLGIGIRYDGVQIPWYSHDRKIKYYDAALDDMVEVGTDLLPAAASGEDVWFQPYQALAGSFMYLGSSNSGVYKIPAANPGSAVDQQVSNYRWGVFHIGQSRSFAGQRNGTVAGNKDSTGLYLSYIDKDQLSDFTEVTAEAYGTGDGVTTTFTHNLTDISAPKTAMYPSVTDGNETFTDDRNGNMVGNLGGTGSVNYATGAVSVTFATAPAALAAITCSYYHETATSTGILDYTGSGNGQGKVFRQDDGGGNLMAIYNINTVEYCLHLLKTWQLTTSLDDTSTTNLPYRNIGIPYPRAAFQTPDGIILADLSRPTDPKLRRLQVLQGTNIQTIEPISISDALDLTPYSFDKCVAFRWGDYEVFCVQEKINGAANDFNSVMLIHNVVSGAWDKMNYYASCLAEYQGTLLGGDSISANVYTLFSGYDEDGDVIENYWTSGDLNLKSDNLKNCRRMVLDGLIQKDQRIKVSLSYDGGPFTDVYTIEGDGSYVDSGIDTFIGGPTIGSNTLGGGGSSTAHPFEVDFPINSDRFVHVRVRFEALEVGYAQVNNFTFKDIRDKGRKNLPSRTQ